MNVNIDVFKKADLSGIASIHDLHEAQEQVLWILYVAKNRIAVPIESLPSGMISKILLEAYGIDIHFNRVNKILTEQCRGLVHANKRSSPRSYRLLKGGEDYVEGCTPDMVRTYAVEARVMVG